jgi:hypothetical protein
LSFLDDIAAESGPLFLVGSCKNAGKTTVLNFLNGELLARQPGKTISLLTIGRDGEAEDAVYGHAKPGVHLRPGNLFVTTRPLVEKLKSKAAFVEVAGWVRPKDVVVAAARGEAHAELIGPANNTQLAYLLTQLSERHGSFIELVDGSFDRRTHVAIGENPRLALVVSADIAATPAAVGKWLAWQRELYALPVWDDGIPTPPKFQGSRATELGLWWRDGDKWGNDAAGEVVFCRGPLTDAAIERHLNDLRGRTLVIEDTTKAFFDQRRWSMLRRRCREILVARRLRLLFVAANPNGVFRQFEPAVFLDALSAAAPGLTIIDVVADLRS